MKSDVNNRILSLSLQRLLFLSISILPYRQRLFQDSSLLKFLCFLLRFELLCSLFPILVLTLGLFFSRYLRAPLIKVLDYKKYIFPAAFSNLLFLSLILTKQAEYRYVKNFTLESITFEFMACLFKIINKINNCLISNSEGGQDKIFYHANE